MQPSTTLGQKLLVKALPPTHFLRLNSRIPRLRPLLKATRCQDFLSKRFLPLLRRQPRAVEFRWPFNDLPDMAVTRHLRLG